MDHVPAPGEIVHVSDSWQEPGGGGAVAAGQLARLAGEAWRPEHHLAWAAAFAVIADVMLSGATEAEVDIAA